MKLWAVTAITMLLLLAAAPTASAGSNCELDGVKAHGPGEPAPIGLAGELVVVVPETAVGGATIVVVGGPSQSVRVEAPPTAVVTAIGGAGAPGKPGASAQ